MLMVFILMLFHFYIDYFANYSILTFGLDYEGMNYAPYPGQKGKGYGSIREIDRAEAADDSESTSCR